MWDPCRALYKLTAIQAYTYTRPISYKLLIIVTVYCACKHAVVTFLIANRSDSGRYSNGHRWSREGEMRHSNVSRSEASSFCSSRTSLITALRCLLYSTGLVMSLLWYMVTTTQRFCWITSTTVLIPSSLFQEIPFIHTVQIRSIL